MDKLIEKIKQNGLSGEIVIPPDKSISHRSLIFSALTKGRAQIKNLSICADCISTLKIFEKLGVRYEFIDKNTLISDSTNFDFNKENPKEFILDCGNSGTTTRLLSGFFARSALKVALVGDESLSKRPMKRIIYPLSLMGADIESNDNKLPLKIKGKKLKPIEYNSPIASAQVKSSLLLAGLGTDGKTTIYEPSLSRNHSEIMLEYLGASIETGHDEKGYFTKIKKSNLIPKDIEVVGDISSAAFFMAAAAIVPNSCVLIKNVGINPTRTGIIDVFEKAQIDFKLLNKRVVSNEETCDILVKYTENIKPFEISNSLIPRLIDEIPILAVLALKANGKSIVKDAQDLRNKESDRIKTIVDTFEKFNIEIKENPDGFEINGAKNQDLETKSKDIILETHLDHRLAMSYFVLSLIKKQNIEIKGFDCVNTSFPEFLELFKVLV